MTLPPYTDRTSGNTWVVGFLAEIVALLEWGNLVDSVAGVCLESFGLLGTAELALAELLSGVETSLWSYPDLPPLNPVVVITIIVMVSSCTSRTFSGT